MPTYRLYRLDGADRIANAEWVEADGDESAVAVARLRVAGGRFELWERNRLVGRHDGDEAGLSPRSPSPA